MDEKTIQRIKKLQALAERGVGGEKTTAQKKLAKLLKDNGINSLDELQKEEYEYTIFSYNGKHEIKLLRQCMYAKTGETTGKGVFTIVEVKAGQGASVGWGRLKSGAGWISLDYATRLA